MPNWCEGKLKIRGKKEDILKWLTECVAVWEPSIEKGKPVKDALIFKKVPNAVSFSCNEYAIEIDIKADAHISGTRRNFVQKYKGEAWLSESEEEDNIVVLPVQAAWVFESEPYEEMSKKYGLDFRFYGYERGMEFNQEIEVIRGETTIDREIKFKDYWWECPDPELGG